MPSFDSICIFNFVVAGIAIIVTIVNYYYYYFSYYPPLSSAPAPALYIQLPRASTNPT